MLACQHSLVDLVVTAYAQKTSLWAMYGRSRMSAVTAQLLLLMDTADRNSGARFLATEPAALALSAVARQLHGQGRAKECDKVLALAKSLFRNPSSPLGAVGRAAELEVAFQRALHRTDWVEAERSLNDLCGLPAAAAVAEAGQLRLQLQLARGDAKAAEAQMDALSPGLADMAPAYRARYYICEAEWFCLCSAFTSECLAIRSATHVRTSPSLSSDAIRPLLSALAVCSKHHLAYLQAVVKMHLAHVQLQMDMSEDALRSMRAILPAILGQHDRFDHGRARSLVAKCLVASAAKKATDARRADCMGAIQQLRKARDSFAAVQAFHRVKDVLYMMVRLVQLKTTIPILISLLPSAGPPVPRPRSGRGEEPGVGRLQEGGGAAPDERHVEARAHAVIFYCIRLGMKPWKRSFIAQGPQYFLSQSYVYVNNQFFINRNKCIGRDQ